MAWLFRFTCWISSRIANEFEVWGAACRHGPDALPVLGPGDSGEDIHLNICQLYWWFGTWLLFFHILGLIIPTDFHIFQRGRLKPPTSRYSKLFQLHIRRTAHHSPLGSGPGAIASSSLSSVAMALTRAPCNWPRWAAQKAGILRSCSHIPTGLGLKKLENSDTRIPPKIMWVQWFIRVFPLVFPGKL